MNKKISTPVTIIIILACAILVAGLAAWQYLGISKEEIPTEKAKEEIPTEKAQPEDKTANWETYRNEEYEYEVKYPTEWNIDKEVVSAGPNYEYAGFRRIYKWGKSQEEETEIYDGATFEIRIAKNPESFTLQEWISKIRGDEGIVSQKNTQIDKYLAIEVLVETKSDFYTTGELPNMIIKNYFLEKDNKIYKIRLLAVGPDREIYQFILNQILSTFRFLE